PSSSSSGASRSTPRARTRCRRPRRRPGRLTRVRARAILVAVFLAAGCTLGPDYVRPPVPVPEGWRSIGAGEQQSLANTPWWELFQAPAPRHLIETALNENKDLQIAVERIEEARAFYGFQRADLFPKVDATASAGRVHASERGVPSLPAGIDNEDSLYT